MFDPFSLALIGGALGGLLDKKDPLRGAALGAGAGYFGPGLLGGAAQAAAPVADAAITPVVGGVLAPGAAMAPPVVAPSAASAFMEYAKPVGQAMSAANSAKGLLGGQEQPYPITPSPMSQAQQTGPQVLQQLAGQGDQMAMMRQQKEMEEKMRRQKMIAQMGMGGGYGIT